MDWKKGDAPRDTPVIVYSPNERDLVYVCQNPLPSTDEFPKWWCKFIEPDNV